MRGAVSAFQRWQFRDGRPNRSARVLSGLLGIAFAAGIGPNQAVTIEVRGRKTGRKISFPIVVVDYQGERYLVAMMGDKTNWVRNLRADNHGVLVRGRREEVTLVEDLSDKRAAILRRYLELAPGARPFFTIDRRAPLDDFEREILRFAQNDSQGCCHSERSEESLVTYGESPVFLDKSVLDACYISCLDN